MTDKPVRTRFAPSPTGYLHIGGARTALLTWLLARHYNGQFILRIEDTDQERYTQGAVELLMEDLRWLGLQWDEGPDIGGAYGPYIQSQRLELYQKWAHWLVEQGKAYRDYSTTEELKHAREIAEARAKATGGKIAGYERLHRYLSEEERARLHEERGGKYTIRFAMPLEGTTEVPDGIRGVVSFPNEELSDAVILKSDGFPTYHLAMAVDDHFMEITHVTRSAEWLPSAGLHKQLYDAFGWEMPQMIHLPVVLNPNGKGKMSKSKPPKDDKGNVIPVMVNQYRDAGYLPEAIVNFLTNLGYSFGDDQEVFPVEETIRRFDAGRINPASGAFPVSKLYWINGVYIRDMDDKALAERLMPFMQAEFGERANFDQLLAMTPHIKERINPLSQAPAMLAFLFAETFTPATPEQLIQKKMDAAGTKTILERCHAALDGLSAFTAGEMDTAIRPLIEELGFSTGQVLGTLRWAVTAQQVSPPLFESMEVLGKEKTIARIQDAIGRL